MAYFLKQAINKHKAKLKKIYQKATHVVGDKICKSNA